MNTRIGRAVGLLAIVILLIGACGIGTIRGSGNMVTESRDVSDFLLITNVFWMRPCRDNFIF